MGAYSSAAQETKPANSAECILLIIADILKEKIINLRNNTADGQGLILDFGLENKKQTVKLHIYLRHSIPLKRFCIVSF